MQAVKLVNAGFVDKVIIFDELPERLLQGIETRSVDGFPRSWARWLGEIGSVRDVLKTETEKRGPGDYKFTHTVIGKEPCFFVLQYTDKNSDKDAWRAISEYLRMNCGPEVRLKEKIEEMALALAPNSTASLSVEPEDIMEQACIVIKMGSLEKPKEDDIVKHGETIIVQELPKKKSGRPRKVPVEA